jgi:hypothetical protein
MVKAFYLWNMEKIRTVSDARTEKNLEDARSDYLAGKAQKTKDERIGYFLSKIEEEKEAIKDCIDQNFFSMAKSKLERIEEIKKKIFNL